MKLLALGSTLALLVGMPCSAHELEVLAPAFVTVAPVVDGDLSDWEGHSFIEVTPQNGVFDGEGALTERAEDFSFEFSVANDDEYLYVAVRITDDVLVLDTNPDPEELHTRAWMDDCVEIFIDGDHNHAPHARDSLGLEFRTGGEFSVVANGSVTSDQSGVPGLGNDPQAWTSAGSYGASGAAYAAPWDSQVGGFQIEARLNYRIMGPDIGPGSRIGFTISAHDDDDGGDRDSALYWKGFDLHAWRDEAGWGDLLLAVPESH